MNNNISGQLENHTLSIDESLTEEVINEFGLETTERIERKIFGGMNNAFRIESAIENAYDAWPIDIELLEGWIIHTSDELDEDIKGSFDSLEQAKIRERLASDVEGLETDIYSNELWNEENGGPLQ